jgi:hypothetical protein
MIGPCAHGLQNSSRSLKTSFRARFSYERGPFHFGIELDRSSAVRRLTGKIGGGNDVARHVDRAALVGDTDGRGPHIAQRPNMAAAADGAENPS